MMKKNVAMSAVYALTLLGLTACGGGSGGTDVSTGVTPTVPTTPTTPTTPTVPEDVLPEFAAATYLRENQGVLSEAVILGDDLYYVSFSDEGNLLSHFKQISEHIVDDEVVEAAGFYKTSTQSALQAGKFSAELEISSDNTVYSMTSLLLEDDASASFMLSGGAFHQVENIADVSALNDQWIAEDYREFSIDTGLNLTAVDSDNCKISGSLTLQDNNVFAVSLSYAECDAAGQYDGVLWAYSFDDTTYLKWFALDSDNNAVIGLLDDFTSQQDALSINGTLKPAVYTGFMGNSLISKGNSVYYRGGATGGKYVFSYPAPETVTVLEAEGTGLDWPMSNSVEASLVMPVPNSKNHKLSGEILLPENTESFTDMKPVAQSSLLASVAGNWAGMTIADDGTISGTILDCNIVSGTVTNYEASIADMQLSLSGCETFGDFNGVAVGVKQINADVILLNTFRFAESGGVAHLGGTLSRN